MEAPKVLAGGKSRKVQQYQVGRSNCTQPLRVSATVELEMKAKLEENYIMNACKYTCTLVLVWVCYSMHFRLHEA